MAISAFDSSNIVTQLGLPEGTNVAVTGSASMLGVSDTSLASFTSIDSGSFLIMSSGVASDVNSANTSGSQGTDIGASGVTDDTVSLEFTLPEQNLASAIDFKFSFLSEEFPEFVGSQFNDFFSVTVNGTEVALDSSNQPITVNNNFFDGSLTTAGTMFDGRTPTLLITAGLEAEQTNSIKLEIGDVGDGIFDSAAFVSDFAINEPQVVYVQFDDGTLQWDESLIAQLFGQDEFTLPGSGLSAADQAAIIANLEGIYAPYNVEFVTDAPSEGEFTTLHIGGETSDLPTWMQESLGLNPGNVLLGMATTVDFGNENKSDSAFILSGHLNGVDAISQTAGHELGHLLGLAHIDGDMELMFPFGDPNRTNITDKDFNLSYIDENNVVQSSEDTQNHHEALVAGVGVKSGSAVVAEGSSTLDAIKKFFGFNLTGDNALFGAFAVITDSEGHIVGQVEIGDVAAGSSFEFNLVAPEGMDIAIVGKSSSSGDYDMVFSDGSVSVSENGAASGAALLGEGKFAIGSVGDGTLELNMVNSDGSLTKVEDVETTVVDADTAQSGATEGNDNIEGSPDDDVVIALGGDDTVNGLDGDDFLSGNDGNDQLNGDAGDDTLIGGNGEDSLSGGDGDDDLSGGNDNDTLDGGDGFDTLAGGDGDDVVNGGLGADVISGGAGNDTLLGDGGKDTIEGNDGDDSLEGLGGADSLMGGGGADTLIGGNSSDTLIGGNGRDELRGNNGAELLDGGGGADTVKGGQGKDTLIGGNSSDKLSGQNGDDLIRGNNGADKLNGGGGRDTIKGGQGKDDIVGGDAADKLSGQNGNDTIEGNDGADVLNGGGGKDQLIGGAGDDTLKGGDGADVFVFNSGDDRDLIQDFNTSQDRLSLDADLLSGLTNGQQIVDAFGTQGGDVVLDFGGGDMIRLDGVSNLTDLAGQIDII